jgi:hypothetical protein
MKSIFSRTLVLIIALSLLLSACNSTPQVQECLVGIWQIDDPDAFARAVLPEGAFEPGQLHFRGGSDEVAYQFYENGAISVLAVEWQSNYDFDLDQEKALMGMHINGFVFGEYQIVDGTRVMVTRVSPSQQAIEYKAIVEGEILADSDQVVEFLPLFVHPSNIADVTCSEDSLSLTLLNRFDLESPITFTRSE